MRRWVSHVPFFPFGSLVEKALSPQKIQKKDIQTTKTKRAGRKGVMVTNPSKCDGCVSTQSPVLKK